jgi:hypothetical protein
MCLRRTTRDHDFLVAQRRARGQPLSETIFQAADLHRVATAARAIWAPCRDVAWKMVQAPITREAQQLKRMAVAPGCPAASGHDRHTRPVRPQTLWGEGHRPGRTFQGGGGGLLPAGCPAPRRPGGGPSPTTSGPWTRPEWPNGRRAWPTIVYDGARGGAELVWGASRH